MTDLGSRIAELEITSPTGANRAAKAVSAAAAANGRRQDSPAGRSRLAACLAVLVLTGLAFTGPGREVTAATGDLVGISSQDEEVHNQEFEEAREEFDRRLREALTKAESGELQADVNQEKAAETLRGMLAPPSDPAEAEQLQAEAIALMERLRAAGDMPPIGSSASP